MFLPGLLGSAAGDGSRLGRQLDPIDIADSTIRPGNLVFDHLLAVPLTSSYQLSLGREGSRSLDDP